MGAKRLYIIGNSHMDPVWLWKLREGRSTWLNTCWSVVKIMEKYPFLKFCRSSSASYKWIEEGNPILFEKIRALVNEGRWEIVGGWVEQSDTIITSAESLLRQADVGKAYFKEKFNRDVRIAYSVDSFGQNAGMPKILRASGFDRYVWMRPADNEKKMPLLFKWRGDDDTSEVVCMRVLNGYSTGMWMTSRDDMFRRLDEFVKYGDEHQTVFLGVGDHGGGIYEHMLEWIEEYRKNFDVVYSTLDEYFNVLDTLDLPIITGEHTHHAPGCYTAVSSMKKLMARTEKNLYKAEKMLTENRSITPAQRTNRMSRMSEAWELLLFNYFHDVYSGTCNAPSYDEEVRDDLGTANKIAVDIIEMGLSCYASQIKTDFLKEGGVLVWNPLPIPIRARVWFDTSSDPNFTGREFDELVDAYGNRIPLQWLRSSSTCQPNGKGGRMTTIVDLEASGMRAFAYGRTEISETHKEGFTRQLSWLKQLSFEVLKDKGDTWGHGLRRLGPTLGTAALETIEEMENGVVGSRLRVRFVWKTSHFHIDLFAWRGINEIEAHICGDWLEKHEVLKLVQTMNATDGDIVSGQSACIITRQPDDCEQPFIDWVAVRHGDKFFGFLTDTIHGYDSEGIQKLRLTVNRPVIYAHHHPLEPHGDEGMADIGAFEQRLWLFDANCSIEQIPQLARSRIFGAEHFEITAVSNGETLNRNVWQIEPACVDILSLRLTPDGICLDLLNHSAQEVTFHLSCNGTEVETGELKPHNLKRFRRKLMLPLINGGTESGECDLKL